MSLASKFIRCRHIPSAVENVLPAVADGQGKPFVVTPPPRGTGGGVGILTDKKTGASINMFGVPLGSTPEELAVRAHEYAHLCVSRELDNKDENPGVADQWYQPCLDNVVNAYARAKGVSDVDNLPLPKKQMKKADRDKLTREQLASYTLQEMSATSNPRRYRESKLSHADMKLLKLVANNLQAHGARIARGRKEGRAEEIAKIMRRVELYFGATKPETEYNMPEGLKAKTAGEGMPDGSLPGLKDAERMGREGDDGEWMKMEIQHPTMDKAIQRKRLTKKPRPGFVGAFKHPLRALLPAFNGDAWEIKPKKEGGSILLDMSGSMSLTVPDIEKLLKLAPYATIMGYSGRHGGLMDTGDLFIMARNGRYVSTIPSHGACNGVDGPALQVLGGMPEPRIWICDGQVTGKGDSESPNLTLEAEKLRKELGIIRVPNLPAFYELVGLK